MFGTLTLIKLGLVAAVIAWGAYGHHSANNLRDEFAQFRVGVKVEAERAAALTSAENRRMKIETEGSLNVLKAENESIRLRAAAESGIVGRLQLALAALRSGRAVPGAAAPATTGEAIERLGAVADECPKRLGALAAAAREGLARARACERHADSIAKP